MEEAGEILWVAGFLEGEGWFYRRKDRGGAIIGCKQVQREPLERLQRFLGGRLQGPYEDKRGGRSPIWHFQLVGQPATVAMIALLPHMSTRRREQIQRCI